MCKAKIIECIWMLIYYTPVVFGGLGMNMLGFPYVYEAWPKIHSLILSLETKVAHKLQALEIREWQALPFLQCFVNKLLSQKIPSSEVNTSKVWRLYFKCTGMQTLRKAGWIRFRSLLINIWLSNTIGTKSDHIQIRIMRVNPTFSP